MEVVLLLGIILVAQGYITSRLSIRSLGLLSPLFSTESKVLHNLHISLVVLRSLLLCTVGSRLLLCLIPHDTVSHEYYSDMGHDYWLLAEKMNGDQR